MSTPEERAQHIIDATIRQYLDPCLSEERLAEACDEIQAHIVSEMLTAIATASPHRMEVRITDTDQLADAVDKAIKRAFKNIVIPKAGRP